MTDLIDYRDGGAGHRGVDTSIAGALKIQDALPRLQRTVFDVIAASGQRGATGDEIAQALGWIVFRVRPRTSELRTAMLIMDSGMRRSSGAGVQSIVWCLPEYVRQVAP